MIGPGWIVPIAYAGRDDGISSMPARALAYAFPARASRTGLPESRSGDLPVQGRFDQFLGVFENLPVPVPGLVRPVGGVVEPGDVELPAALAASRGWPFSRGVASARAGHQRFQPGCRVPIVSARAGQRTIRK